MATKGKTSGGTRDDLRSITAHRLTPALLAKAFRGELVPQDPNDEPASVLLERVKADKATTTPTKAKRQKKTAK